LPEHCYTNLCDEDGNLAQDCEGQWGGGYYYDGCSVECGGGRTDEMYIVITQEAFGGMACPEQDGTTRQLACNTHSCSDDGYIDVSDDSASNDVDGNSQSPVAVSAPSTIAIFALGIMGLSYRRFKKQS
jgi:hypothetical protein